MSDNKKYYYLKLKENFFDSDAIIVLESMPDGYLYCNILLKLYLRSLKNEGRLMFNNSIPYNPHILAQVTRHPVGVIEKALKTFKQLELIEILESGEIYMLDIQTFIGESSTEADRIRDYRKKISEQKSIGCTNVRQMYDKRTPELEIERELKLEKDINKEGRKKPTPAICDYSPSFLNIWDNVYPHASDRGSKTQAYKNWCNLLREGISEQDLVSAASNYKTHCELKGITMRYKCSNFFGEKRYFEGFKIINITETQREVLNEQRSGSKRSAIEVMRAVAAASIQAVGLGDKAARASCKDI